jgi:hypothetical protein
LDDRVAIQVAAAEGAPGIFFTEGGNVERRWRHRVERFFL